MPSGGEDSSRDVTKEAAWNIKSRNQDQWDEDSTYWRLKAKGKERERWNQDWHIQETRSEENCRKGPKCKPEVLDVHIRLRLVHVERSTDSEHVSSFKA